MATIKLPVGALRQRSPGRDKGHKTPSGNCAAAAATNMTRRKSLSVSDISSLSLSPGGRGARQRVPENDLGRQSKSAQSSQSSLLGGAGPREAGGRSLGGSIGDLMNSGEFRPAGAGWSPRTCSPITLSMVSEGAHRSEECLHALPPTISLDETETGPGARHRLDTSPARHNLEGESDSCRRSIELHSASPNSHMDMRHDAGDAPGTPVRAVHRKARYMEHKVTIAVDGPHPQDPPDPSPPPPPVQNQEGEEQEPVIRERRRGLQRGSKKMSMVERTQHLALLIHDQQQRSRREAVVLPVS
ncbi:uncharacterized protein LOC135110062 [Scylla paramamosain]|uniref:uncharacterized protein LOC135110062 n=1 Tax=Scylla paramamosain TaxID=85552 RepID=UPI003083CC99